MNNRNQKQSIPEEIQGQPIISQEPKIPKKPKCKCLIPIVIIVGIVALGAAAWGIYNVVKPGPESSGDLEEREPEFSCENLWWYDNEHNSCQEPKQFCGTYMYYGLATFETKEECENALATKDWEVYRDEDYRFEFKYPNEWLIYNISTKRTSGFTGVVVKSIRVCVKGGSMVPGPGGTPTYSGECISVSVRENYNHLSIKEWLRQVNTYYKSCPGCYIEKGSINIGGIPGLIFEEVGMDGFIVAYVVNNDFLYSTSVNYGTKQMNTYNQILSTFKFLE